MDERGRFERAIYFIVDANYFGVALLQAQQALRMSGPGVSVHVFLEGGERETGDEGSRFEALRAASGGRLFLHVNELTPRIPDSFPDRNLPKLVYGRFYAPEILQAERILYLDVDIMIRGPLDGLLAADMGAHPVAAVHDYGLLGPSVGDPDDAIAALRASGDYFNAGVLLLDRERWLGVDLDADARVFFAEHGERASFQDQDFLNWAFRSDWAHLSPRWNFQSPLIASGLQAAIDPALLHFSGHLKPWHLELRELFPGYAEEFGDMALRAGISPEWKPKRGRVAYTKPMRALKYRLLRLAASSGLLTPKMKRRRDDWQKVRDRLIDIVEDMVRRDVYVDPVDLRLDGAQVTALYDGRRYWAAA